jgi:hypothetical protein
MKTELEEAAEKYVENFSMSVKSARQIGFIDGAKLQAERIGLMEIELNHTKTLLASCEKALEDREKKAERMYSEEEVLKLLIIFSDNRTFLKKDVAINWFEQNKKKQP